MRLHGADGLHAEDDGFGLMDERAQVAVHAAVMREPMAVEAGETASGLRLVDGRVVGNPGITLCDLKRIGGELFGKGGIEKIGMRRAAAMVHEANDGTQVVGFHGVEHTVCFLPVME